MRPRRTTIFLAALLALLSLGAAAQPTLAQVFDFDQDREPMVLLDGLWHFHPGDDPPADPRSSKAPLLPASKYPERSLHRRALSR